MESEDGFLDINKIDNPLVKMTKKKKKTHKVSILRK